MHIFLLCCHTNNNTVLLQQLFRTPHLSQLNALQPKLETASSFPPKSHSPKPTVRLQNKVTVAAFVKNALFQFLTNCPPAGGKQRRTIRLFASEEAIVPLKLRAVLKHLVGDTCLCLFYRANCFFAPARQPARRTTDAPSAQQVTTEAFIACCQQLCLSPSPPRALGEIFFPTFEQGTHASSNR